MQADEGNNFQHIDCPYCGESIEVFVDSSVPDQQYIEDCQVCCSPITIVTQTVYTEDMDERIRVTALHENEYI